MYKESLLKILYEPHVSEKASVAMGKQNTLVFKVSKTSNKLDIKVAVQYLFGVKVVDVRTLIVKGKIKKYKKYVGRRSDWKKAYISLKKGEKVDLLSKINY